jgi:hypothetical protein
LPTSGYESKEVEKEIARIEGLHDRRHDTQLLLAAMKLLPHVKTLEGFCEFTGTSEDVFSRIDPVPDDLVQAIYESIHGPPRPGFIPMMDSAHAKGLGDNYHGETLTYPGDYHYIGKAIILSSRTGVPLLNDVPGLQIPGMPDVAPVDDAKLLASILAVQCTQIILPPVPLLQPEDLMEFRGANAALLRGFRRSMLRYAADLNGKIKGMDREEFERHTKFFVETQIVPAMDELNTTMNDPARPWHRRAIDGLKIIPQIGGAFFTGGASAAFTKAISASAAQFFVEVSAKGDKEEVLKRSGLTYLLRLKGFLDDRT